MGAFEADVRKFRDLSEEVLAEEAATSMRFLRLDCGPLKQVTPCVYYPCLNSAEELWHALLPLQSCSHAIVFLAALSGTLHMCSAQVLAAHCEAWIAKFQGLIHSISTRHLAALYETLAEHTAALGSGLDEPENLKVRQSELPSMQMGAACALLSFPQGGTM